MKCYTMHRHGIRTRNAQLRLGESGRGRRETLIPVMGVPEDEVTTIAYARVGLDCDGNSILKAEEGGDEDRVLILLNAAGGHRGSVSYSLPEGSVELASGSVAQGIAGRMGGWRETLAIVPTDSEVEYHTSGGGGHIGGTRWLRILEDGTIVHENVTERKERLAREAAEKGEVEWL